MISARGQSFTETTRWFRDVNVFKRVGFLSPLAVQPAACGVAVWMQDLDDSVWGERLKRELNTLEADMERHERSVLNVDRWGRLQRGILSYERLKDMKRFSFGSRVAQGRPSVTIAYGDALQG